MKSSKVTEKYQATIPHNVRNFLHLKKGDRFDVIPGKSHTAQVGPNGCRYVVGEMIKGDS